MTLKPHRSAQVLPFPTEDVDDTESTHLSLFSQFRVAIYICFNKSRSATTRMEIRGTFRSMKISGLKISSDEKNSIFRNLFVRSLSWKSNTFPYERVFIKTSFEADVKLT